MDGIHASQVPVLDCLKKGVDSRWVSKVSILILGPCVHRSLRGRGETESLETDPFGRVTGKSFSASGQFDEGMVAGQRPCASCCKSVEAFSLRSRGERVKKEKRRSSKKPKRKVGEGLRVHHYH